MDSKGKGKKSGGGGGKSRKGKNDDSKSEAGVTNASQSQEEVDTTIAKVEGKANKSEDLTLSTDANDSANQVGEKSSEVQDQPKKGESDSKPASKGARDGEGQKNSSPSKDAQTKKGNKTNKGGGEQPTTAAANDSPETNNEMTKEPSQRTEDTSNAESSGTILRDDEECFLAGDFLINTSHALYLRIHTRVITSQPYIRFP
jgi:hypothetical protein